MKIQIVSDLHFEHEENKKRFTLNKDAELLIIAGDLGNKIYSGLDFIKECASKVKTIFILGNHDSMGSSIESTVKFWESQNIENFYFLNNKTVEIGGVHFIGTTLWSDVMADPINTLAIARGMIDYHYIFKDNERDLVDIFYLQKKYEENLFFIQNELKKDYTKKVLITHHLPTFQSIAPKYYGSSLNAAFASDLSNMLVYTDNLELCIHGHTHEVLDYMLDDKRIICNPLGYPGEHNKYKELILDI